MRGFLNNDLVAVAGFDFNGVLERDTIVLRTKGSREKQTSKQINNTIPHD